MDDSPAIWSLAVSANAAVEGGVESVEQAVAGEGGQGALALLIIIVMAAAWLALRAKLRRPRAPPPA